MNTQRIIFVTGSLVAVAAAAATAHGMYIVALASRVPWQVAGLYPAITDGLALVAYAATTRLSQGGRAYAWTVVVLIALMSGLAQAVLLAAGGETISAPWQLAFGIGAWPALAAAIVAHLLFLLHRADKPAIELPTLAGATQPPALPVQTKVAAPVAPEPLAAPTPEPSPALVPLMKDRPGSRDMSNDKLAEILRVEIRGGDPVPSRKDLIERWSIGGPRADTLRKLATEHPPFRVVGGTQ